MSRARQKTWAVIGEDGRHVWLGRYSDPTEEEIAGAERGLATQGLAGWVAVVEGDYWSPKGQLDIVMVRALANPTTGFRAAVEAFEIVRQARLADIR